MSDSLVIDVATPVPTYLLYNPEDNSIMTYVGRGEGIIDRIRLLDIIFAGGQENNRRIQEAFLNNEETANIIDLSMHMEVLQRQAQSN